MQIVKFLRIFTRNKRSSGVEAVLECVGAFALAATSDRIIQPAVVLDYYWKIAVVFRQEATSLR